MSIELKQAAQQALKALEAISDEMTVGERYTNAGQYLLDALGPLRAALSQQPAQAAQAEVTDGIRPEDFTVDVVVKPMGGFAPVNTQGVRVTHKPTGISVTCDAARSQHTNRHQAFEKLSAILATPTAQAHPAEVTDEQILEVAEPFGAFEYGDAQGDKRIDFARAILALRPERVPMTDEQLNDLIPSPYVRGVYMGYSRSDICKLSRAIEAHHGIIAQPKKEGA